LQELTKHNPHNMNNIDKKESILKIIREKSAIKQQIFDNTLNTFNLLKKVLKYIEINSNSNLEEIDERIHLQFKDQGKFDGQLKIAGDLLIFSMHTNAYEFDRSHMIWQHSMVTEDPMSSYCGMISIYNFLNDSFKYNRIEDLGYLIARIFINKDGYYFVEGKRQMSYWLNNFGTSKIDKEILRDIVNSAILYALEFDLLVPPYDNVKIINVEQINNKIESSRIQTGKRLGFTYNSDDVS
jgi:hypothetical protein